MATRLIEAVLPQDRADEARGLLTGKAFLNHTILPISDQRLLLRVVVDSDHTEHVLDELETRFGTVDGFEALVLNVEATLPRPLATAGHDESAVNNREAVPLIGQNRISREELYARVSEHADTNETFFLMVGLSTIVAAVGLLRDDVAVIISAMVIAPLLGPNVGLALATTLADETLMWRALRVNAGGVALAFGISLVSGWLLVVDPSVEAIASRTSVGVGDIVLALAAGSACALAYTTVAPAALIGVMVAVALLPPLVVVGLLTASGELGSAAGALLLVATNVICVNLAGVVTFLWQGIRPRTWWEADRARQATWRAVAIWLTLLIILGILAALHRD